MTDAYLDQNSVHGTPKLCLFNPKLIFLDCSIGLTLSLFDIWNAYHGSWLHPTQILTHSHWLAILTWPKWGEANLPCTLAHDIQSCFSFSKKCFRCTIHHWCSLPRPWTSLAPVEVQGAEVGEASYSVMFSVKQSCWRRQELAGNEDGMSFCQPRDTYL